MLGRTLRLLCVQVDVVVQLLGRYICNVADTCAMDGHDFVTTVNSRWQRTRPTGVVAVLETVNGIVCIDVDSEVVEGSTADTKHSEKDCEGNVSFHEKGNESPPLEGELDVEEFYVREFATALVQTLLEVVLVLCSGVLGANGIAEVVGCDVNSVYVADLVHVSAEVV